MHSSYHSYSTLRQLAENSNPKRQRPYLLNYYRVSSHVMGTINGIKSPAARIQNCLAKQINDCKYMPRMIVILPDNDIIKHSNIDFLDFGARKMCEAILPWLVNMNNKMILAHREDMKRLKPGAVLAGEPKVIYAKMIYRPKRDHIQAIRNQYNVALENALCKVHNHYVLEFLD